MNDRHPSGTTYSPEAATPDASYGYAPHYGQEGGAPWGTQTGLPVEDDPLFGPLPGGGDTSYTSHGYGSGSDTTGYSDGSTYADYPAATAHADGLGALYDTGVTAAFDTGALHTGMYDTAGFTAGAYDTGAYDTATTGTFGVMAGGEQTQGYDAGYDSYDGYDTGVGTHGYVTATASSPDPLTDPLTASPSEQPPYAAFDGYGEQQWDSGIQPVVNEPHGGHLTEPGTPDAPDAPDHEQATELFRAGPGEHTEPDAGYDNEFDAGHEEYGEEYDDEPGDQPDEPEAVPLPRSRSNRHGSGNAPIRNRRRKAAKRSALLTVAVPSVAVMGVAAVAAATVVSPDSAKDTTSESQPDEVTTVASSKLDQQLASLAADADDFADRASRTQERIDLKERQAAEKRRKELEAKRKEALRPKVALPVSAHGLSAQYGQAGVNWMSLHTGIDFPVSYGTPVMAATDGIVSTKWGGAYGNMAIVTHADGTETWYCHLSSTKIRSGPVKAGDVIAYSGNSGNSTGPHLHFEVHPGGGVAVDPLQWLLSKGLDPR